MEHWNNTDPNHTPIKLRFSRHLQESDLQNKECAKTVAKSNDAIEKIYLACKEVLANTSHTLEQVQYLSYIETYCINSAYVFINYLPRYNYNISEAIKGIENVGENFESFKRRFNKKVDDLLEAIFGKGKSLAMFYEEKGNPNNKNHVIDEEDAMFLLFLFASCETDDAICLVEKNYAKVGDAFYDAIKSGAETLIEKNIVDDMTKEELQYRFDITFGRRKQEIEDSLANIISIIGDIVCCNWTSKQAQEGCSQCIDILNVCEKSLHEIKYQFMDDALPETIAAQYQKDIKGYTIPKSNK